MDSTLLKGLAILERVVAGQEPVSVSALSRELNLPKSNIHRTLSTLREAGYVLYDSDRRRYYSSLKLVQMGDFIAAKFPFRTAIKPELDALVERTGESAHFACLDGEAVVFLTNVLPSANIASFFSDNLALRWDDSAFGIALASRLAEQTIASLLGSDNIAPETGLLLQQAKENGYVLFRRHGTRRIFELAVPVVSDWGKVIGALGITGPASRFSEAALPGQIIAVKEAAERAFAETARLSLRPGQNGNEDVK